jgi:hypothetical protein
MRTAHVKLAVAREWSVQTHSHVIVSLPLRRVDGNSITGHHQVLDSLKFEWQTFTRYCGLDALDEQIFPIRLSRKYSKMHKVFLNIFHYELNSVAESLPKITKQYDQTTLLECKSKRRKSGAFDRVQNFGRVLFLQYLQLAFSRLIIDIDCLQSHFFAFNKV